MNQAIKNYRVVGRETVETDIKTIELVTLTEGECAIQWKDRPRHLDRVYVVEDVDCRFGVLDVDLLGFGSITNKVLYFDEARSVEECIALWIEDRKQVLQECEAQK